MKLTNILTEKYADVEEKKHQIIQQNVSIKKLQDIWTDFEEKPSQTFCDEKGLYQYFAKEIKIVSFKKITPEDISSFCIEQTLHEEISDHFGFFLSAIVNKHFKETKYNGTYQLVTKYCKQRISGFGFLNEANILIQGNCRYVGAHMKNGNITVENNCDNVGEKMRGGNIIVKNETPVYFVGHTMSGGNIHIYQDGENIGRSMSGGTILIEGNGDDRVGNEQESGRIFIKGHVGKFLGQRKKGGKIEVHGECGSFAGYLMKGGVIHLLQGCDSISQSIKGGEIYSRGKRVYPL